jgi:hypothetical protein
MGYGVMSMAVYLSKDLLNKVPSLPLLSFPYIEMHSRSTSRLVVLDGKKVGFDEIAGEFGLIVASKQDICCSVFSGKENRKYIAV